MSWRDVTLGELAEAFTIEYNTFTNEWDTPSRKRWAEEKYNQVNDLCTSMYDAVHPVPYVFQHMLDRLEALVHKLNSMRNL